MLKTIRATLGTLETITAGDFAGLNDDDLFSALVLLDLARNRAEEVMLERRHTRQRGEVLPLKAVGFGRDKP